jgi:hypothetical protein
MGALSQGRRALSTVRAVFRRWVPDRATPGRARVAVAVNLGSLLLAAALYALIQPPTSWDRAGLLVALGAIAVVAYLAEANLKLPPAGFFDASLVLAMLALGLGGPVAALLVWLVPEAMARVVTRRVELATPGFVATASSFALAALAGAGVLALAAPHSASAAAPALYTAGLAMAVVNFTGARLLCASFYYGFRPRQLVRTEFVELAPTFLSMLALGVVVWLLVDPLGVFALAPLVLVIVAPQLALARLSRPRPAGLTGAHTPRLSRILAVAVAWSELTASGTVGLTHGEALLDLATRSGTEFDPDVVAAAAQVVRDEEVYVGAATFAPRLHRLALPRAVRRRALPAALARLGAEA